MLHRRHLFLLAGLFAATTLSAQVTDSTAGPRILSATLQKAGPEKLTLESVRECPRYRCGVVVETGTVEGTRIRVGDTDRVIPLYLTGQAAYRFLSVVPAAKVAAARGRQTLRNRLKIAAVTAGLTALVFVPGYSQNAEKSMPVRVGASAVIIGTGIYFGNREQRKADPHFEEAVRLYNLEVKP